MKRLHWLIALAFSVSCAWATSPAFAQAKIKFAPIVRATIPAEVAASILPVFDAAFAAELPKRIDALRVIQAGWLKDWQTKKITSAQFREYRYFSDRALIEAVGKLPDGERHPAQATLVPFLEAEMNWCDVFNDPSVALDLFAKSEILSRGDPKIVMQPRVFGLLRKVSALIEALPDIAAEQKLMSNVMIVMATASALNSMNADILGVIAHASKNALAQNAALNPHYFNPEQAKMFANVLLMSTALLPGPERVELNRLAVAQGASYGSDSTYIDAVNAALASNWAEADRIMTIVLADEKALGLSTTAGGTSSGAGIMSMLMSPKAATAEAGGIKALTGQPDAAMTLFERSRTAGLSNHPAKDPIAAERLVVANGEIIVQVAAGWMGTFAVVSRSSGGKLRHNVAYSAQSGGISVVSNYIHMDDNQQYVPGGVLAAYYIMRTVPRVGDNPLLNNYVDDLNTRTENLVGGVIRQALAEAGAKRGERVVVILPATLAMLPVAGSHPPGQISLGERYELRFALSLDHASETIAPSSGNRPVRVSFLTSSTSGLASAAFEQAGVVPTNVVRDAKTAKDAFTRMDGAEYWHVASHGSSDWGKAEDMGIYLDSKSQIRNVDIRSAKLTQIPRLIFLSACETAILDISQDLYRYDSLQTAFVAMGARGVIGTLWPVGDTAAALLSVRFHDYLIDDHLRPAAALRKAQQWLRESNAQEFRTFVSSKIRLGIVTPSQAEGVMSGLVDRNSTDKPFAHPFYWTSFQLLGA